VSNMPTIEEIRMSEMRELRREARKAGCKVEAGEFLQAHEKHGDIYRLTGNSLAVYAWFDSNGTSRFSVFPP